jgi:uncharacterized protein DUF1501
MSKRGSSTRRDVLKLGAMSCLLSQGIIRRAIAETVPAPQPTSKKVPRYYLLIKLGGGHDAVLTTDPKARSEVESWVDVPYRSDAIVDAGKMTLGPQLAALRPYTSQLALINNVQTRTVNHPTGNRQFVRLRTSVSARMPSVLDIIGAARDEQPLGSVSFGDISYYEYTSGWFGKPTTLGEEGRYSVGIQKNLFDMLDETDPEDLGRMADALSAQVPAFASSASDPDRAKVAARNNQECAALFRKLPTIPRFREERWSQNAVTQWYSSQLQRALWCFENDLSRCAYFSGGFSEWDSHHDNLGRQTKYNIAFFEAFGKFVGQLKERKNRFGSLDSNVTVVVGSELGRFPRLNATQGKDHIPEVPFLVYGAGINGGSYGRTGKHMQSLPMSYKTGKDVSSGGRVPYLDDLGATLLHIAGLRPATYGYDGQILDFLVGV